MLEFTVQELARYNGKDGAPAYIAHEGKVYDVSNSFLWQRGRHQVLHRAGEDLTESLARAPHGEDLLERVPVIGVLKPAEGSAASVGGAKASHSQALDRGDQIMPEPGTRFNHLVAKLKKRGHRLTPQRVAVLRILAASEGHPSVEQIYDQIKAKFPTTSLATIYKTVTLLKEMGEVLELGFGNGSNRYDGNRPYPHPHLICTRCGESDDLDIPDLQERVERAAQDAGYQIVSHRLDLYGLCPRCRADQP